MAAASSKLIASGAALAAGAVDADADAGATATATADRGGATLALASADGVGWLVVGVAPEQPRSIKPPTHDRANPDIATIMARRRAPG